MLPILSKELMDVRLDIQGDLLASKRFKNWEIEGAKGDEESTDNGMNHVPFLYFQNCDGLVLESSNSKGKIDGQGYMWWFREFLGKNLAHRPKLIEIASSRNIEIMGLFITNSPSFHIVPH